VDTVSPQKALVVCEMKRKDIRMSPVGRTDDPSPAKSRDV